MIAFYVFAGAMVLFALLVLFRSLTRKDVQDATNHRDVNIGIARDRQALIKDAFSKGHIDQSTYDQELSDIENTLAAELADGPNVAQLRGMRMLGGLLIIVLLPVSAAVLYQRLGTPKAMDPLYLDSVGALTLASGATVNEQYADYVKAGGNPRDITAGLPEDSRAVTDPDNPTSLQELLPQLEAKLAENPDDAQGWMLLGRTYMNIGDFANAERALERLNELQANEPDVMVMLAESKALQVEGTLSGEPERLIRAALSVNPEHQRARLLLALALQQQGEHEQAIAIFQALRADPSLSEQVVANLTQMIDQSRAVLSGEDTVAEGAQASLTVSVSLDDTARAAVDDEHAVFIYARATEGPPMPLAAVRYRVADLPITVTLDDTQAMIPTMTLSSAASVTVGARVSASGNAIGQTGDWFGELENISTANEADTTAGASAQNPLRITIDQQRP